MKLSLLPAAKTDALESIDSFNKLSPGLGEKFEDELFACFERIKQNPKHYAETEHGFRASRLNRFRAVVYFRLTQDSLIVVRIMVNGRHENQDIGG